MTLRTLNYGNYGIFLIMGHAGFCPSTVGFCKDEESDGAMQTVPENEEAGSDGV